MLSDRRLIELVRRADPVPDVEDLPEPRLDAAAFLAVAGREGAMGTITDHPETRLSPEPPGRGAGRARLAFTVAALVVVASIGVVVALRDGPSQLTTADTPTSIMPELSTTLPASVTETAGSPSSLSWEAMRGTPDLNTVRQLTSGCCWNIALGDGHWSGGWGGEFRQGLPFEPIPESIGTLRMVAVGGGLDMVGVVATGASAEPFVATKDNPGKSGEWRTLELPTDVPSPYEDVVLHYTVRSVTFTGSNYVVFGSAVPVVDPTAVEREYPELAPVVRIDAVPPCCEGEPLSTEIADPLWVWTGGLESEPTAVSLSTFGPTVENLQEMTGVVWTINVGDTSSQAGWGTASTALVVDDAGFEFFLDSGDGSVLLTAARGGGYDTWASRPSWTQVESAPADVIDLTVWGDRPLILTAEGAILELTSNGKWVPFSDAGVFDLEGAEPAQPVGIKAGKAGIIVVGEREEPLSWSAGEPIPTAQVLWFSSDGQAWHHQELSDVFDGIGAVEVAVVRHGTQRPPATPVIVAFGLDQANGEPITDPQWWTAQPPG